MMFPKDFITYNDKLYWIYRRLKESTLKEEHLNFVKEAWHCDLVLKTKNQDRVEYVFVREIEEVKLVN